MFYVSSLEAEVKFSGASGSGVVGAAVQKVSNQRPVGVSAVDVAHSDAGLAGVYIAVEGQYAEPTVKAAFAGLKEIASGVDAATFEAAKTNAKLAALVSLENPESLALDQAAEILANGAITSPLDLAKEISQVTAEDVKKVIRCLLFNWEYTFLFYLLFLGCPKDCPEAFSCRFWPSQPGSLSRSTLGCLNTLTMIMCIGFMSRGIN